MRCIVQIKLFNQVDKEELQRYVANVTKQQHVYSYLRFSDKFKDKIGQENYVRYFTGRPKPMGARIAKELIFNPKLTTIAPKRNVPQQQVPILSLTLPSASDIEDDETTTLANYLDDSIDDETTTTAKAEGEKTTAMATGTAKAKGFNISFSIETSNEGTSGIGENGAETTFGDFNSLMNANKKKRVLSVEYSFLFVVFFF